MKRYEIEAVAKNFTIFFTLQALLLWVIYSQSLNSEINRLKENTLERMKLCSFTLDCKEYAIDFVPKQQQELVKLFQNEDELYSLFHMPGSDKYYLKLSIDKQSFQNRENHIKEILKEEFFLYGFFIALLSLLFSFYTLYPLRKALRLNEEFIKDILHDYNTPISSLLINFKLLKKEIKENKKLDRMKNSIDTMLMLQNNLKYFLQNSSLQLEKVSIKTIILDRVEYFKSQYPNLEFITDIEKIYINVNKDAFIRVIDNLLSNACKHNIKDGFVKIYTKDKKIYIENSTKDIKNPKKIFERYYKESQRGLGIGLDIVKKLTALMQIDVRFFIKNRVALFTLDLKEVILR